MSYRSRVYRQRNAQQNEHDQTKEQEKFFNRSSEKSGSNGTKSAFFQAKPNDATASAEDTLEKEANQTAEAVNNQPAVTDKKEEAIQKLATPEEDKLTSTNDERQKNDKEKQS
jgi:hypothetical protein